MTLFLWSKTAATNNTVDSTINWQEGQAARTLNDSARAMMAAMAKYRDDMSGNLLTGGSATALTVTTNQVFTSLIDGLTVTVRASVTTLSGVTFSPDGLTAKAIATVYGTAMPTGGIVAGGIYTLTYDSTDDKWIASGAASQGVIGEIKDFSGLAAPALWLLPYGQAISRTTYAALFEVTGTTYGVGDGSTTFNLPDLRGRVLAGKDDMGGVGANRLTSTTLSPDGDAEGASGGTETHALTSGELAAHTHSAGTLATASDGSHFHSITAGQTAISPSGTTPVKIVTSGNNWVTTTDGAHTHSITGSTASSGSDTAHNNVQPTLIVNKIIFAGA